MVGKKFFWQGFGDDRYWYFPIVCLFVYSFCWFLLPFLSSLNFCFGSLSSIAMIFETVLRYFSTGIFSLILTSLGLTWLGWRIWRFTLLPIIEPQLPKEYPYLIPCMYEESFILLVSTNPAYRYRWISVLVNLKRTLIYPLGHTRAFLNDADKVYTAARLEFLHYFLSEVNFVLDCISATRESPFR